MGPTLSAAGMLQAGSFRLVLLLRCVPDVSHAMSLIAAYSGFGMLSPHGASGMVRSSIASSSVGVPGFYGHRWLNAEQIGRLLRYRSDSLLLSPGSQHPSFKDGSGMPVQSVASRLLSSHT